MVSADSNENQINRLIAEIADSDEPKDPNSIAQLLQQKDVSASIASAVAKHFADAAALRGQLKDKRTASPSTESVQSSIGPYQLVKKLGEGGMGSVWLAEQSAPIRRQVAVKLMRPGLDSEQFLRRFETERQAQALMDHPNVAKVLDAGATEQGAPYFVMEYLPGQSLTRYCRNKGLDTARRLNLFLDLCQAIQHAHQKGVIHRDIKPSNVIVCEINSKPVVKVIDFGLARAIDTRDLQPDAMTQFGTVLGSLPYMSPEQARGAQGNRAGEDIDTRTDVYSLGAVLFELLTGTTPIPGKQIKENGVVETLRAIQEDDPPRPSVRLQELSHEASKKATGIDHQNMRQLVGDLDWIVIRALEIDRDRRYDAVSELSGDVERFLDDEPISARPPSRVYLMQKFVRKHRVAVASSAMVVGALVVGLVVAAWYANEARLANADLSGANAELEEKNTELAEANQLEKSLRREQAERQIEYLISRGQWAEAKREISILETDNKGLMPQRIQLANLAVLDGLQQTQAFKQALKATETQDWDSSLTAQRDLWRGYGYLLDGSVKVNPTELINHALDEGTLSIADVEFARGLVAESLEESIARFEKALEESSFHLRARLQLVITLILTGRHDEVVRATTTAIEFFPNDVRFYHAKALNAAMAAKRPETLEAIRIAKSKFPEIQTEYIQSALGVAEEFAVLLASFEENSSLDFLKLAARLQIMSVSGINISVREFYQPQVFQAFSQYVRSQTNPFNAFASVQNKVEIMKKACQESYEIHPDALFLHIEAMANYSEGHYSDAEVLFRKAISGFSLLPAVANEAKYFAFASRTGTFAQSQVDLDLQTAVDYLNDYQIGKLTGGRFELAFRALAHAGRYEKARQFLNARVRQGGDQKGLLKRLAQLAEQYENFGVALKAWGELLVLYPDDPEIDKSRVAMIRRMAKLVESTPTSAGD